MSTQYRVPTSSSATGSWVPASASVYTVIDDAPPLGAGGDGDSAVHGTTAGALTLGFAPFNVPDGATNLTVYIHLRARKNGTQTNNLAVWLIQNTTGGTPAYRSAAIGLSSGLTQDFQSGWAYDPATNAPWTVAAVNALTAFGTYSSDASPTITIYQMFIMVMFDPPYLATPTNFAGEYNGTRPVLTWTLPANATGIEIIRGTAPNPWQVLTALGAVETFEDADDLAADDYYYKVAATDGADYYNSLRSADVMVTVLGVQLPSVTSVNADEITQTTATGNGNVTSDGGATITERGICWGTSANPTKANSYDTASGATGVFEAHMTSLALYTQYHWRAYAINSVGTSYGSDGQFWTLDVAAPTVTTQDATDITATTATGYGNVTSDGGLEVTERGICWADWTQAPTKADHYDTAEGTTGAFEAHMTGLTPGESYFFRAYAINSAGTSYGDTKYFDAVIVYAPTVTTQEATGIDAPTATGHGDVTSDGNATITERGVCWGTSANPTTADSTDTATGTTGAFEAHMTSLVADTLYHYRAYAINSVGTSYGADTEFTATVIVAPTVATGGVTGIADTTATGNGNVTDNGGGAITERGICWGTSADPTTAGSHATAAGTTGLYTAVLGSLAPVTLYHYRAYASNSAGTSYGADAEFTTAETETGGQAVVGPTVLGEWSAALVGLGVLGERSTAAADLLVLGKLPSAAPEDEPPSEVTFALTRSSNDLLTGPLSATDDIGLDSWECYWSMSSPTAPGESTPPTITMAYTGAFDAFTIANVNRDVTHHVWVRAVDTGGHKGSWGTGQSMFIPWTMGPWVVNVSAHVPGQEVGGFTVSQSGSLPGHGYDYFVHGTLDVSGDIDGVTFQLVNTIPTLWGDDEAIVGGQVTLHLTSSIEDYSGLFLQCHAPSPYRDPVIITGTIYID